MRGEGYLGRVPYIVGGVLLPKHSWEMIQLSRVQSVIIYLDYSVLEVEGWRNWDSTMPEFLLLLWYCFLLVHLVSSV